MVFKRNYLISDIHDLQEQPVIISSCYCAAKEGRVKDYSHFIENTSLHTKIENDTQKST